MAPASGKRMTPQERAKLAAAKRRAAASGSNSKIGTYSVLLSGVVALVASAAYFFVPRTSVSPLSIDQITAPRVQLSDGRHLAVHELGADADNAKFNVLVLHSWHGCRLSLLPNITNEFLQELGVRLVSYDRPGYGQSDPHVSRSLLSDTRDISELADLLKLGSKFHIIAIGGGGPTAWAALAHIPEKVAGVGMVAPAGSFLFKNQSTEDAIHAWVRQSYADRVMLIAARYAPSVMSFLWKQVGAERWSNHLSFRRGNQSEYHVMLNDRDLEILASPEVKVLLEENAQESLLQGPEVSFFQDLVLASKPWGFELSDINVGDPVFPSFSGNAYIWQGTVDHIVPYPLQSFASSSLPSLNVTFLDGDGHFFIYGDQSWPKKVLTTTLGI